jgi:hypothetical protein
LASSIAAMKSPTLKPKLIVKLARSLSYTKGRVVEKERRRTRHVVSIQPYEPVLTSLRVQGNFQADSGTPNSLIGFPKPNSTKTLKCYEIMNK